MRGLRLRLGRRRARVVVVAVEGVLNERQAAHERVALGGQLGDREQPRAGAAPGRLAGRRMRQPRLAGVLATLANGAPLGPFSATFFTNASTTDLWGSVLKCTGFGAIVAIVCCYKGMTASGGAEGVGRAVNQAVVISLLGVAAFNYVFTQTLLATHPELQVLR